MRWFFLAVGGVVAVVVLWAWIASPSERLSTTGEANCPNIVIDWVDVIQIDGVRYYISHQVSDVAPALSDEVGKVQFNVSANVCDPGYRLKDGDATFLLVGAQINAVQGYDPRQVLAVGRRIYEARPEGGSIGRDQLPFSGGVERIAILSIYDGKTELGAIENRDAIDAFVHAALDARVDASASSDWNVFLEFQLADGLKFQRNYSTLSGVLRGQIILPPAAQQIVNSALAR